jgi:hypothetical protein
MTKGLNFLLKNKLWVFFGIQPKVGFMNFNMHIECMENPWIIDYIVWQEASPKSDVYSFGVLLIQLVNGSPFIPDGYEIDIHHFIKWAQKVHVQKDGFKVIIHYVVVNNSIVGFNHNEVKLILQISFKCIQVTFFPNLLSKSLTLW